MKVEQVLTQSIALSKESLLGSYSLVLSEQGNGNVCESERGLETITYLTFFVTLFYCVTFI